MFPSVAVIIAHANALVTARHIQARFDGDVRKRAVVVIAIKMVGGSFALGKTRQSCAVHQKNVEPAVVIVVENGGAGAYGCDDVFFRVLGAEGEWGGQSGFFSAVSEV